MSKQKTESNDGNETEKKDPEAEHTAENRVGETNLTEESHQADGQDTPVDEDSALESLIAAASTASEDSSSSLEDGAEENLVEWLNSVGNDEEGSDSAENGDYEVKNGLGNEHDNKIAELEAKLADLAAQLADARDQLLRKTADFENFRKRMNQEKQNAIEFANQTLLLDIIPIIADFERALQSAETSVELTELPAGKALLDGIAMIETHLTSQLESKWGLKRFSSAGEPFDPNYHEAMMMEKSPDVKEPMVKEDFAKGYTLKDRVIRAAKVKVIMPQEGDQGSGTGD
jgi:molecular chaperone GrpE